MEGIIPEFAKRFEAEDKVIIQQLAWEELEE